MKVIMLEAGKLAEVKEIDGNLEGMQSVVRGYIEPCYFTDEPVCIIVNEEGKTIGLDLNRGIYDEDNCLIDIIAGPAFICGLGEEDFVDLTDEQIEKYLEMFKFPEQFYKLGNDIKAIKYNPNNI
jgi:hypothetical protein